tara:strand:- start:4215 stop:4382 length:168 start_codon:yes stop_codon:yes gene_type:complete
MLNVFFVLNLILFSYFLGDAIAHSTIATECKRLGGFYVGNKTYKCVEIEHSEGKK